ncbi:hypothetical protein ACP275_03G005200 [Erythranthe tilingii]
MCFGAAIYFLLVFVALLLSYGYKSIRDEEVKICILRALEALCVMVFPVLALILGEYFKDVYTLIMFISCSITLISILVRFRITVDFGSADNIIGIALGILINIEGKTWKIIIIALICRIMYIITYTRIWLEKLKW